MTREEAKRRLLNIERCTPIHTREDVRDFEALEMAIKALEQKPRDVPDINVGDMISRQAAIDGLASIAKAKAKSDAQKSLMGRVMFFTERLPSVTPQEPKTGHWIKDDITERSKSAYKHKCDRCGAYHRAMYDYCPSCGCRMVEPQESEG